MSTIEVHTKTKQLVPELRFPEFDGEWHLDRLKNWDIKVIDGDRGTHYPKSEEFLENGYCLFLNAKNVTKTGFSFEETSFITKEKDELLRKGRLEKEDIVLTTRGSVGHFAFNDRNIPFDTMRINSGMVLLRNQNEEIAPLFTYHQFFSPDLIKQINIVAFGSAQPQLTVKEIEKFKLRFPSLPEQQKIASFLSAVDEKIQELSRKKALLEQYKKGVMQQIFSQQIWFKDENGNPYPDWEEKKLEDIAEFSKGKGVSKADLDPEGNLECIRYGELYTAYTETIDQVESRTNTSDELVLSQENDIIIPASGETQIDIATASCVLRSGIALGGDLNIIRTVHDGVFLAYYLNNALKTQIARLSQGISVVHLYSSQLKTLKIKLPSIQEQKRIGQFLRKIELEIERINEAEAALEFFKKGLLQKMFVAA